MMKEKSCREKRIQVSHLLTLHISHTHLRIDHDKRDLGEVDATNNVEDDLFKLDV